MFIIVDDFFSKEDQDKLEDVLLTYPYTTSIGTVYQEYKDSLPFLDSLPKFNDNDVIQFESRLFYNGKIQFCKEQEYFFEQIWNPFVKSNIKEIIQSLSTKDLVLDRMKSNILPRQVKGFFGHVHHTPHTDAAVELYDNVSCIYYINDSDGPTVLFNEYSFDNPKKLTLYKKINPKKGRLLAFHSNRYHTSSSPRKNSYRHILNMVMMPNQ